MGCPSKRIKLREHARTWTTSLTDHANQLDAMEKPRESETHRPAAIKALPYVMFWPRVCLYMHTLHTAKKTLLQPVRSWVAVVRALAWDYELVQRGLQTSSGYDSALARYDTAVTRSVDELKRLCA